METLSSYRREWLLCKAIFISLAVEVAVLLLTVEALASSFMRHSAVAYTPPMENLLVSIAVVFHLPSILITYPFELFGLIPVVQVVLMSWVLYLVFRSRARVRLK